MDNHIILPNGQVMKDIHFLLPVSFVCDSGKYTTCTLHDDEDVMTMFFMFIDIFKLTCQELYITTMDQPTQTCAHPLPISTRSFNFEGLDEYLAQAVNLESSFEENPLNLFDYYFIIKLFLGLICLFFIIVFLSCRHLCFNDKSFKHQLKSSSVSNFFFIMAYLLNSFKSQINTWKFC